MPMRNPFKKTGSSIGVDTIDPQRPHLTRNATEPAPEHKPALALSIKGGRKEPNEYKLCVVNDSGVYLPPSPTEKASFWNRSNGSTPSSNHRSMLSENEHFSISRESFESYRRSFDISAKSPIVQCETTPPRQSLDSRFARLPRSAISERRIDENVPIETDEGFEDVGLNDEVKPKKKSLFSRFAESNDTQSTSHPGAPSGHHGFHFGAGRKLGHSGQGSELGKIDRPSSSGTAKIKVDG